MQISITSVFLSKGLTSLLSLFLRLLLLELHFTWGTGWGFLKFVGFFSFCVLFLPEDCSKVQLQQVQSSRPWSVPNRQKFVPALAKTFLHDLALPTISGQFSCSKLVINKMIFLFYCLLESCWSKMAQKQRNRKQKQEVYSNLPAHFLTNFTLSSLTSHIHRLATKLLQDGGVVFRATLDRIFCGLKALWKLKFWWVTDHWTSFPLTKRKKVPISEWTSPLRYYFMHRVQNDWL